MVFWYGRGERHLAVSEHRHAAIDFAVDAVRSALVPESIVFGPIEEAVMPAGDVETFHQNDA